MASAGATRWASPTRCSKRYSKSPSQRATSVLVPPMSKAITRGKPERRPARAAPTTPPAGPERRPSLARKASARTNPPALVIMWRELCKRAASQRAGDAGEIALQDRREIGVDHRRLGPGDELDQRRQLRGEGDVAEAGLPEKLSNLRLVPGIPVGVHQRDRHGLDPLVQQAAGRLVDRSGIERDQHRAVRRQPLRDLDGLPVERLRLDDLQREEVRSLLGADAEEVGESSGDQKRGRRPLALEQRVRSAGGGEPHGDLRQILGERGPRHQPGGEDWRLLGGAQLESSARQIAPDRTVQAEDRGTGVLDGPRLTFTPQQAEGEAAKKALRKIPGRGEIDRVFSGGTGDPAADGARREHLGPVEPAPPDRRPGSP